MPRKVSDTVDIVIGIAGSVSLVFGFAGSAVLLSFRDVLESDAIWVITVGCLIVSIITLAFSQSFLLSLNSNDRQTGKSAIARIMDTPTRE
ncbi:hypothetical protein F442_01681 [Phytophthora nicotianae P10297]|uniref:Uncharacterized protein n=1 Tax=Phytophthora nicotianae P10297 TaxID=1317064 RepID=W3A4G9_PHYNI|nr:hypothetical protein F442_01681 [Phytophthora nicotianae P10297]